MNKSARNYIHYLYSALPILIVLALNFFVYFLIIGDGDNIAHPQFSIANIVITMIVFILFTTLLYIAIKTKKGKIESLAFEEVGVSIIVPVYNEEKNIYEVLKRISESTYPSKLIEIIIINDGSKDQSLLEIKRFQSESEGDIKIINFEKNKGKKAGLVHGFKIAKHGIVITIDSDTFLEKEAIPQLLSSFTSDVSAVCGLTDVYNYKKNLLTTLQQYEYFISHQLFKSFEAYYNCVLCCPGCFSAYKKQDVMEVMDEFEASHVLTFNVDYGEDRYLTALLLKNNKKIKYAGMALGATVVPDKMSAFITQRKRWIKSWFLVSLFLFKVILKKPLIYQMYFYLSFFFNLLIVSVPFMIIYFIINHQFYFLIHASYIIFLYFLFSLLFEKKLKLFTPILFYLFTILIYFWLLPFSILNLGDKKWGSRGLS